MSNERRQHYRVSSASAHIRVSLRQSDGALYSVGLLDVSAGGVALACNAQEAPPVAMMEIVTLCFASDRLGRPLEIDAQIRHIQPSDDGASVMYGARFLGWADHRADLGPQLRALFNEREAVRVDPRDHEDIPVQVEINGKRYQALGLLRDISILGIGIWLNTKDEAKVEVGSQVTVNVSLPNAPQAMQVPVLVRHLHPHGRQVRLGVEIADPNSRAVQRLQTVISRYVMKRQIEMARVDAERRRAREAYEAPEKG